MSSEKFNQLVKKVTKQFGDWCTKNGVSDWEKQKEYLTNLLIRNKLLKTDDVAEFWRAVGSTCDFMDDPKMKSRVKNWEWHCDVAFCVLYMDHCIHRGKSRKIKNR